MIYLNAVEKGGLTEDSYTTFLKLLAPFAPHLAEELWHVHKGTTSIHLESYPKADTSRTVDTEITIAVQINGKMRGSIIIQPDEQEETVLAKVMATPALAKYITHEVLRHIYVPNKIINIITN
jgi:leucyl-tRNA synthetase